MRPNGPMNGSFRECFARYRVRNGNIARMREETIEMNKNLVNDLRALADRLEREKRASTTPADRIYLIELHRRLRRK